jgi:hypothetical protein
METNLRAPGEPGRPVPTVWDSLAGPSRSRAAIRAAYLMSWGAAVLMIAASIPSVLGRHLYTDGLWGREALRGGDLVTLVVVAPILILSLWLVALGSRRAVVVWMGVLAYGVYDYAFYVFGATFNPVFLLHMAVLSLSVYALACALPNLDAADVARPLRAVHGTRWVGLFLAIVGAAQGLLWVYVVSRNALTGWLLHDIPVNGQHLVFALDLTLAMPALVLGGILLLRRTSFGYVLGGAMSVMGAIYQVNLLTAGVYQAGANVPGVTAFAPDGVALTVAFIAATLFLLVPRTVSAARGDEDPRRAPRRHLSLIHSHGDGR